MGELPKGFTIEEGEDDYGPVFTLRKGGVWLDEDFDRDRIVALAHHLARPTVSRKTILEVLCHAEDRLIEVDGDRSPIRKKVRAVIDVMFAENAPASGGRS